MTLYLSDFGPESEEPLTVDDLTEQFGVEPQADSAEIMTDLFVALMNMDDLMGDDPVKYEGMERLVAAMASVDEITGMESQFEMEDAEGGLTFKTKRKPTEKSD